MPSRSDYATGETVKVGARVDEGIYSAFREWVESETGKQYNEVGNALEWAMLEYMNKDRYQRIESELGDVYDQTTKNEALLRQVLNRIDGEKEKEKATTAPQGKDPGSRRQREALVIQGLLLNDMDTVKLDILKEAIREFAEVSSDRTVQSYVEALTDTAAFQSHPTPEVWRFDKIGAQEVTEKRGINIPNEVEG